MEENSTSYHRSFNVKVGQEHRGGGFGLWLGLGFIVLGAGWLLDAFGVFEFSEIWSTWWPSLIMLIAIAQIATRSGGLFWSGTLFTVGALLQLSKLGYLPGGFWSAFWPIVLVLFGISLIASRFKKKQFTIDPNFIGRVNIEGSRIDKTAIFTGVEARVTSQDFSGGEATAIFGGVELDLREAGISGGAASLDATAIFGGVDIMVPPTWNVIVSGTPIFGGIDDKSLNRNQDPNAPKLFISATAIFGGVEIH